MKYKTIELYGIDPRELAKMSYYEALIKCKSSAVARRAVLVHEAQKINTWDSEKEEFIKYLSKTIKWCEEKLKEIE